MNEPEKDMLREWRGKFLNELREAAQVAHVLLFPKAERVQSPPPTREGLLEWARSTRELRSNKERREQVLMIVERSREAADPPSVAEIFEAAYGDQAGQEYWRLWLKFGSGAEVERLLVAHLSAETPDVAPPPGWSWGPCCAVALARYPTGQLVDRIRSIAEDEELGHLVTPSAHAFLVSEITVAATNDPHSSTDPERGKKPATLLLNVIKALREIHPTRPPAVDREATRKAVERKIGRRISLPTLDRARKKAWP
jgi:hypothetical protein